MAPGFRSHRFGSRHPLLVVGLFFILQVSSCSYLSRGVTVDQERDARISSVDFFGDSAQRIVYPDQNWSSADSLWFYTTTQGSNLMPYDIFLNLEVADSATLFRSDENMNRLRYLPQKISLENPDGLPIGWVKNEYKGERYIGFTCAACHTGQINYRGTAIRIDGAPTLSDMQMMLQDLSAALDAALNQTEKFDRLAARVLEKNNRETRNEFRSRLASIAAEVRHYNLINEPRQGDNRLAYGYARLDAFGRIYNRILSHLTPDEVNYNPANAPVSYPVLWDTPQHDFVQWNGVGDNQDAGPLGRNTGEAMGVFATFELTRQPGDVGFRSSVNLRNLAQMEARLAKLWSPSWRELADRKILPPIDEALAAQGREIFQTYQCQSCHQSIVRTDENRRVTAQFSSLSVIGTDPAMARNALLYTGRSGRFEGQRMEPTNPASARFGETTRVLPALSLATAGVVFEADHNKSFIQRWSEKAYDLVGSIHDNPVRKTERHLDFQIVNKDNPATLMAYKARPLNGIWAAAPYLHNGSVPSLYDMFLPHCSDVQVAAGEACRPNRFSVGTRELDPVKVGYVERDPAEYPGLFLFDATLAGNSNAGHSFAAEMTPVMELDADGQPVRNEDGKPVYKVLPPINDQQRLALVEFLKTL